MLGRSGAADRGTDPPRASPPPRRRVAVLSRHLCADAASPDADDPAWTQTARDYRTGMFRPVPAEADALPCAVVQGCLPRDLAGTYLRNGPNPLHPPRDGDSYHYFDGDGMVCAFRIDPAGAGDGAAAAVTFSHKWVRTARFERDRAAGASVYEFGSLARGKPVFHRVLDDDGVRMGKANTSLVLHANRLLALEEADLPYELALPGLATMGRHTMGLAPGSVFTAHPKVARNGDMVGFGSAFGPKTWEYYVVSGETGRVTTAFPIDLRSTSYNHDCAITEAHSVCFDGNLVLSEGFGAPRRRRPHAARAEPTPASMWTFRRDMPGRIGVFPRHSNDQSQVTWFEVEPFCVSHTVNAYEDGEEVVVVANCIGFEGFECTFSDETPQDDDACLREWRLNMRTGVATDTILRRVRSDFPSFNLARTGLPFRFVFAQLLDYEEPNHAPFLFGCYKFDLARRETVAELRWGAGCRGGEAVFVPRRRHGGGGGGRGGGAAAAAGEEDDGYLLVLVHNGPLRRCELRVYDARTFDPRPVATIVCPRRVVPLGTHGLWVPRA